MLSGKSSEAQAKLLTYIWMELMIGLVERMRRSYILLKKMPKYLIPDVQINLY